MKEKSVLYCSSQISECVMEDRLVVGTMRNDTRVRGTDPPALPAPWTRPGKDSESPLLALFTLRLCVIFLGKCFSIFYKADSHMAVRVA